MSYHDFHYRKPFVLASGKVMPGFQLRYWTRGTLNKDKSNVLWVFHAFTSGADVSEWWPGLTGVGKTFDPDRYFIICVNMPGSCYGSTGPLSINEATGTPYYDDFPVWTIRDMVRAYQKLKAHLGLRKIDLGVGGSMGGQQLLEWAVLEPDGFKQIVLMATNAKHSAWGIAFNATQRACIEKDVSWGQKDKDAGKEGMKTARGLALLSYRHYDIFEQQQEGLTEDSIHLPLDRQKAKAETYQTYQGEKLARRFNAFSYYFLSISMDKHDVGRGRGGLLKALKRIRAKTLIISLQRDLLFPEKEQLFLNKHIQGSIWISIPSLYGHDGFLIETPAIGNAIRSFLKANHAQTILL